MIRLCTSNRIESLADALADGIGAGRESPFDPIVLVVPNALVEGFVKQRLARKLGVAANVHARGLRKFLRDVARANAPGLRIVDRDTIEGEVLALFHDERRLGLVELAPVRDYLGATGDAPDSSRGDDGLDRRRVQLASKLAGLYDEYAFSRPEMLDAWRAGRLVPDLDERLQRWQRELWLALFGRGGTLAPPRAATLPDFFAAPEGGLLTLEVPPAVHVFGISYVARLYRSIFAALARASAVHVYALNPCREFWEDLEPARRTKRNERRFPKKRVGTQLSLDGTVPPTDARLDENPLLALWGKPGRDNIHLLNQLAEYDDASRFVDPMGEGASPSLLATLQQEVLDRKPRGRDRQAADGSLVLLPAPDPRRELESIAAEIWTLVRRDEERERRGEPGVALRFNDFAVVVPVASAPAYLPLARAVFHEASELPHTIVDPPFSAEARIVSAVELLLALPNSDLARPDLLRLAMHPAVARRFPEVDPEDWLALCEELQIVRGADREDHRESYLDRDGVSWDQGLRRLALGAFLSGRPSGQDRPFPVDGEPFLPAEVAGSGGPAAAALGLLARELIELARTARAPATLAQRLDQLRRAISQTIRPATPDEEAALGDCYAVLDRLGESMPGTLETSALVVAELVRARLREATDVRRHERGVTVASFIPMRALPFRVVFVAGMDDRVFPSSARYDALDLRGAGPPRPGDVTSREQDQYMFLETLLSVRERLYLSWVARDSLTGDTRDPSSAVLALRELLGPELADDVTRPRPPLARHEDEAVCAVIPAAARERQAAALGASLRAATGTIRLPPAADLRTALAPEAWAAIAPKLGWREAPTAEPGATAGDPRRTLSLADLRRFLECPLQGSVRVLLPLRGDDDAAEDAEASLREHENLEDSRVDTVPLLRGVFARALEAGGDDDALAGAYDAMADLRRLDGTLPSGFFGRSLRERHLNLLRCWRDGLRNALGGSPADALPGQLVSRWFGPAPEHRTDLDRAPAIPLSVALPGGAATIGLGGPTELLTELNGERISVGLIASHNTDYVQRDLLRPWLTHLALAASGAPAPLRAILIRPDERGSQAPRLDDMTFQEISSDHARAHLSALAAEMLGAVHAYLLPCEGVFSWWRRPPKREDMTVRQAVLMVRDDNWTRLSSERGPVPNARLYTVPSEAEAQQMVDRRFEWFLAALTRPKNRGWA